ncbi:LysR substrate-binding domain-containing protein [Variovorax sp. LjRoot84]|uniref:LysR substrate-binding domain-containing protein n=1 Tax=unclassified Variovorax TaxID=663243 RepID=UPI003ECD4261
MTQETRQFAYGHLKLRHLHLLGLLETEGSITRAAEALNLTQPAVSAMLRELESIFDLQMVQRSPRGVSLTPGARAALRRFSIALAEVDSARDEALFAEQHARQRLRVGALTIAMVELIPSAMRSFLASAGHVRVEISEGTVDGLTDQLMRGELDCVVGRIGSAWARSAGRSQLAQTKLFDEPRCLVCRVGHPLAVQRSVGLRTLGEQQWILPPLPSSSRLLFDELFLMRGLTPPLPTVESVSVHSNMDMVATTDLLAVAPLAVVRRHVASGHLHKLPVSVDLTGMSISVIWRRTGESDALVTRFRDALVLASAGRARKK